MWADADTDTAVAPYADLVSSTNQFAYHRFFSVNRFTSSPLQLILSNFSRRIASLVHLICLKQLHVRKTFIRVHFYSQRYEQLLSFSRLKMVE